MKKQTLLSTLAVAGVLVPTLEAAQPSPVQKAAPISKNRVRLNGNVLFNVSATFSDIGGFPLQSGPGTALGVGVYDDGFNTPDALSWSRLCSRS
jgi:hypothetical protein